MIHSIFEYGMTQYGWLLVKYDTFAWDRSIGFQSNCAAHEEKVIEVNSAGFGAIFLCATFYILAGLYGTIDATMQTGVKKVCTCRWGSYCECPVPVC